MKSNNPHLAGGEKQDHFVLPSRASVGALYQDVALKTNNPDAKVMADTLSTAVGWSSVRVFHGGYTTGIWRNYDNWNITGGWFMMVYLIAFFW